MDCNSIKMMQLLHLPIRAYVDLPGFLGYNPCADSDRTDLRKVITTRNGQILDSKVFKNVGSFTGGGVERLHYTINGTSKTAYLLYSRFDIDSFGEESIILDRDLQNEDACGIEKAFDACREAYSIVCNFRNQRLESLDEQFPKGFRSVLAWSPSRRVACNIYEADGVLSQKVFEPYKGSLAYPKTELDAVKYFEQVVPVRPEKAAYFLVGSMISNHLLPLESPMPTNEVAPICPADIKIYPTNSSEFLAEEILIASVDKAAVSKDPLWPDDEDCSDIAIFCDEALDHITHVECPNHTYPNLAALVGLACALEDNRLRIEAWLDARKHLKVEPPCGLKM